MKLIEYTALAYIFVPVMQLCAEGFVADTLVYNFGTRPSTIQQICDHVAHSKRQIVSSWHEQKNRWASQAVRRAGTGTVNCTITLVFDDNPDHDIICSPIQLFYDSRYSAWVEAYKLHAGDRLLTESGNAIQLIDIALCT
jgi:hypothetical protein